MMLWREYLRFINKRTLLLSGLAALILLAIIYGFRSAPVQVDTALVTRGYFSISVEEEGRTRVPDRYQVSAPIAGYLSRIALNPGDPVRRGMSLFSITPSHTTPLDARSHEQAKANLQRNESALALAKTQVESELARVKLADMDLARIERLAQAGHVPIESLDRAQTEAKRAAASLRSSKFAVDVAIHERDSSRAALENDGKAYLASPITISCPVDGVVLKRLRQSEGSVQLGEPIMILGDLASLDVEVDVLSPDAVRLRRGMRVELQRWGGEKTISGRVERVEPAGFTRFSALGVEEQRVWVIVQLDLTHDQQSLLGDAYRVEARFILWEGENVLQAPSSALFRQGDTWTLYVIERNRAQRRIVKPGRRSGLVTEIIDGVKEGEQVVLYPGQDVVSGTKLRVR